MTRPRIVCPLKKDGVLEDNQSAWSPQFQIMFNLPEIHAHLSQGLPASASPLGKALESFLSLTTDYGNSPHLSTRRKAFSAPAEFAQTFDLLEQGGYVERVEAGDKLQWTDNIAPMMRTIYAWDENGVPEEEIDEMWKTLPWIIYKRFFSHMPADNVDITSLSIVISQLWCDGKWQEILFLEVKKNLMPDGDLPRAIALKEKFRRFCYRY